MKIRVIALGSKMPAWVSAGVEEYARRLPRDYAFSMTEIPLAQRSKSTDIKKAILREGEACLQALRDNDFVVALDVKGVRLSTEKLAEQLGRIRDTGRDLALLIGGPDGLAPACLERAEASWSLSDLTLPHPLVRVLVAEQVYRAWSMLHNHPYHRA